ncbi:hypothetical protein IC220_06025 [Wolbachia endosymbiont of Pentalonia nigronervosa]|jgi:hypothetical protein|uniref:hypothetical protein n=1 Tax=Wolbachia endosymbiont of Pentalonia nigronervosa TaxID=1301914 RepID=UPI00165EC7A3|nr:hypothetical protein [Wolbachia endosymbiont of Pentalonia nigronervosa]MBD0391977.1 hypothetical protein [Wolbachia endosymbiont of Pentalonia nigronervosa]
MKKEKLSNLKSAVFTDTLKDIGKSLSTNLVRTSKTKKQLLVYPAELNPFSSALSQIRLNEHENSTLSAFLEKAIVAKTIDELSKVIDEVLDSGIRINAHNEDGFSFSNVAVLKMHYSQFTESKQEDIIKKLALNGANFDEAGDNLGDENIIEICRKVQREVEPQIHTRLTKLREVAENAAAVGSVENVEIDSKNFYIKFSHNSKVNVVTVIEGAKRLGFSNGNLELGINIIQVGKGKVEIKTGKNGERNYSDVSDNSSFTITFSSSLGELHVIVYQDKKNYNQVKVEVEDQEMWNKLQTIGEVVGQGCLFGDMPVKTAIERGSFVRRCLEII